jgi:hypothetical protein
MDRADLQKLWQLADEAPRPKARRETPANTLAFARTGGDGVHFNFVLRDGRVREDSPILMAVPMNVDRPHVIVGRDLRDFLALGVGRGFFLLDGLVYDPESFLGAYPAPEEALGEREREQLLLLRAAFAHRLRRCPLP